MTLVEIGIVGPEDTVPQIEDFLVERAPTVSYRTFIYQAIEDVPSIIDQNDYIPVWLFSGQAPFAVAKDYMPTLVGTYPKLSGSSLGKVLLTMSYKDQLRLERISFDTILADEVVLFYEAYGLETSELHLFPYKGHRTPKELIDFHLEKYQSNDVVACVTGILSVHQQLKLLGIPSYRILPTSLALQNSVDRAIQLLNIEQLKKGQVAAITLEIADLSNDLPSLKRQQLQVKMHEALIAFTKKVHGSFVQISDTRYVVFSTYGALEVVSSTDIQAVIHQINQTTQLHANIGIGYGNTVERAEHHSLVALKQASSGGWDSYFIVDANGMAFQRTNKQDMIQYATELTDEVLLEKLERAKVSSATYSKCFNAQRYMGKGSLTANDLAEYMDITLRSARRILNQLEEGDLARIVGEEQVNRRGRPRQIYEVL